MSRSKSTPLSNFPDSPLAWLKHIPIAHRGLHGERGAVENSRAAVIAAAAAGYGSEVDVQLSADGQAMVFHDDRLARLTGRSGRCAALDAATLRTIPLKGSSETIPRLVDILGVMTPALPLLVELKNPSLRIGALEAAVAADLAGYRGKAAVFSANPLSVAWFARHAPAIPRGLVITTLARDHFFPCWAVRLIMYCPLLRAIAHPQFLAPDVGALPLAITRRARRRGRPVITWTVRSPADRARAARHADGIIFETFLP